MAVIDEVAELLSDELCRLQIMPAEISILHFVNVIQIIFNTREDLNLYKVVGSGERLSEIMDFVVYHIPPPRFEYHVVGDKLLDC